MSPNPAGPANAPRATTRTRRSGVVPGLVGVGLALLAAWLLWPPRSDETGDVDAGASGAPLEAPAAATLQGQSGARIEDRATTPWSGPHSNATNRDGLGTARTPRSLERTPQAPAAAGVAVTLRVTIDVPASWQGQPPEHVYALPAGGSGAHDVTHLPHALVLGTQAVLALPSSGPWDIGYRSARGHVLRTGVTISESSAITLAARDAAPITLELAVSDYPPGTFQPPRVGIRTPQDEDRYDYPGRGQRSGVWARPTFDSAGLARTEPLPGSWPYRVVAYREATSADGVLWVAEPPTARAGDTVRLRPIRGGNLVVTLRLPAPLPPHWATNWSGNLHVGVSAAAPAQAAWQSVRVGSFLKQNGTFTHQPLTMTLAPGSYVIGIMGSRAFEPRRVDAEVRADSDTAITLDVVPKHTFVPSGGVDSHRALTIKTDLVFSGLGEDSRGAGLMVFHFTVDDAKQPMTEHHSYRSVRNSTELSTTAPPGKAQAFRYPDRASDLFQLQSRGETRVAMLPAGMLVMVPERTPAPSLGTLTLRRRDRAILPFLPPGKDQKDRLSAEAQVPVTIGGQIGPLPVGTHAFDVLLGGAVVGQAQGEVRAGRMTPLAIPIR